MLERQSENVFDSLKRRRAERTVISLRDDDSDPAIQIAGIPGLLSQNLGVKGREAKAILIAVAIDDCKTVRVHCEEMIQSSIPLLRSREPVSKKHLHDQI